MQRDEGEPLIHGISTEFMLIFARTTGMILLLIMQPSFDFAPEAGAVYGQYVSNSLPPDSITGPPDWGVLPKQIPPSFVAVEPVTLQPGTTLYRAFSSPTDADPYPSWEVGSWWSPEMIGPTEADWRGGFAVEVSWNGGQYYVAWTVPETVYAWSGPTARQYGEYVNGDTAPDYYLPGGDIQVYVDPTRMPIGQWDPSQSPWIISDLEPALQTPLPVPEGGYRGLT
jgi:hypothetical protein